MQEKSKNILPNELLADNLRFLREQKGLKQHEVAEMLNVTRENITSYENGTIPKLPTLLQLGNIFYFSIEIMGTKNLQEHWSFSRSYEENVNLISKSISKSISKTENLDLQFNASEPKFDYSISSIRVPIMDTAAGASTQGFLTQGYIDEKEVITLPASILQKGRKYVGFQVRGESMLPTLEDKDYVVGKLLDVAEYQGIKSDEVYAVVTQNYDMIIKRVQNKLSEGYLYCYPDNIYHRSLKVTSEDILQVYEVVARLTFQLHQTPLLENLERILTKNRI